MTQTAGKKYKLVISDCHLSGGLYWEGHRNPHEDFFFDDEMVEFLDYYSAGQFGEGVEVEIIINGDFFDPLNISYQGEFEEVVTEQFAVYKLERCLQGHPKVVQAFRRWLSKPGKTITYNVGNHDADFLFPAVQAHFIKTVDPVGRFPSPVVRVHAETPGYEIEGGLYIEHGNQFEAVHNLDFKDPLLTEDLSQPVLNMPWGSIYVIKIVNRFKRERDYVDKVRPVKAMVFWGLFTDTWFTLRFAATSAYYFLKTRFANRTLGKKSALLETAQILQEEAKTFLQDLQDAALDVLKQKPHIHTVIFGHTHLPMHKVYGDGRSYINTGTWTKMINMDFRGIGSGNAFRLTFCFIEIENGLGQASLLQWQGIYQPVRPFRE